MSLAILTKKHIMESFKKLTLHTPFYKISTLDVVKLSGINKNTFYYHFDDKYDLIRAIFRIEFGEMLLETFNRDMLVFSDEKTDKYSEMPYYLNARNRKDNLDYSALLFLK